MAGESEEKGRKRPHLMALAGSARAQSLNRRLLATAARAAEQAGATVTIVELRDLELPPYDGDFEAAQGLPAGAEKLKAAIAGADGLLIASPEYNHSIPGTLKNALDWASRGSDRVYDGKSVALIGAAPGALGAVRALLHLRQVLAAVGAWVVPGMVAVPRAGEAFDEQGDLKDETLRGQLEGLVGKLVSHAARSAEA